MSALPTLPATSEADFQRQVLDLAGMYRWRCFHTFDSRRSAPGFPDLVLLRASRLIFAELKTATGRVAADQHAWLDGLDRVCSATSGRVEVYLWRPADLQRIAEVLS